MEGLANGSSFYQVFIADQTTGNVAFALLGLTLYAVANLPSAAFNGALAYDNNGRKGAELADAGTGSWWRIPTVPGGG